MIMTCVKINDRNKTVGSICVPLVVPENTVLLRAAAKEPAQILGCCTRF